MILKHIVIILVLLFCDIQIFAQQDRSELIFEKISGEKGDLEKKNQGTLILLKTEWNAMKLIEKNDISGLLKLFKDSSEVNRKNLQHELILYHNKYNLLLTTLSSIRLFTDKSSKEYYFERNFCKKKGDKIEWDLQIHIYFINEGDTFFIKSIEFRRGNQIEKRPREIKELLHDMKEWRPAPPPPLPVRE